MRFRSRFDYSLAELDDCPADELSKFRVEPRDNAFGLGISLTRRCNFNCMFCYYHSHENSKLENCGSSLEFAPESIAEILDALPFLTFANVSLEGEAFCHSRFLQCLEIIARHATDVILTTNGSLLTKDLAEQIASLKNSRIILSFEEGSAKDYEHFRKGANFEKFKNAVGILNSSSLEYQVYSVLFQENKDSFLNYPNLARELGIKKCAISILKECPSSIANCLHRIPESELVRYLLKLHEQFLKNEVVVTYDPYIVRSQNRKILKSKGLDFSDHIVSSEVFCSLPWSYTNILADGSIFPCCGDFMPLDVSEFSFDSIFNNRYLLLLRKKLTEKKVPEVCLKCRNLL